MVADPRDTVARSLLPTNPGQVRKTTLAITKMMVRHGALAHHVRAMISHIAREDPPFDPRQRQVGSPVGKGGFGLLQWTGRYRADPFMKWAREAKKDPLALDTQVQWLEGELLSSPWLLKHMPNQGTAWNGGSWRGFLKQSTDWQAADYLMRKFIQPEVQNDAQLRRGFNTAERIGAIAVVASALGDGPERVMIASEGSTGRSTAPQSDTAKAVAAYQQWLNENGGKPSLRVDGIIGPATRAAVGSLSRDLETDLTAIIQGRAPAMPKEGTIANAQALVRSLSGGRRTVEAYQSWLNSKLSPDQQLVVDGVYGPLTHRAAVRLKRPNMEDLRLLSEGQYPN